MTVPTKYCFKSTLFKVEPGEDEETNPCIYGKQFSEWLTTKLNENGYKGAVNDAEDWGWAVSCQSKPFYLFVACASFVDYDKEPNPEYVPAPDEVIWQCFVSADKPLFRNPFKKLDVQPDIEKLQNTVFNILDATEEIERVPEP